jgi:hypothetical protein
MTAGDQLSAGLIKRVYAEPRPASVVMGWLEGDMKKGFITEQIYKTAYNLVMP